MTTDGSLIFDTKMDDTDFNRKINSVDKRFAKSGDKIKAILNDTERTAKSKAAAIAAEYRKMGESQSEAFKHAWKQIERDSSSASESINTSNSSVSDSFSDTADDITESSDLITMAIKAGISVFEKIAEVAENVANAMWTATTKIAQGIGYVTTEAGKFTLKQFIGDWESENSGMKQLLLMAASAFSIYKIFDFGQESVELGSNLTEVQNVVDTVFTTMSEKVNQWAVDAKNAYGLSETMAKNYVGLFGSMADAFGFTEQQSYDMATSLAGLAGDVASFYNISQDLAYTKLKSVFSGETETLKDLGIVMTQSALDNYALANGLNKTISKMTEAEKVSLRYNFILDQLSNATGDFARTQDSWANQIRILQLRWQSLQSVVGRGLINALTPAVKILNIIIEKLQIAAEWFENLMTAVFGDSSESTGAITEDLVTASDSASELADSADSASDSINDINKSVETLNNNLADYDDLNVMSDTDSDSDISDTVADIITATGVIDSVTEKAKENAEKNLGDINFTKMIQKAVKEGNWKAVGKLIGKYITSGLKNIKWSDIKKQAKNIATNIVDFINGAISGIKWADVGKTIAEGLNTAIIFINTFLSEIDWDNLGTSIAIGLNSFLDNFDAKEYGSTVANKINAIFEFLGGFAYEFDWENLGNKLGETLYSYFETLNLYDTEEGHSIPETIAKMINGIIAAGIELFTYIDPETGENIWASIGTELGKGLQVFFETFKIKDAVTFIKEGIGAIVKLIYNVFKQLNFTELGTELAKGVNGWLDDDSWWIEIGQMINEIFNDILDFAIAFINELDVNKVTEALGNFFGNIDFSRIVGKVIYLFQTALLKGISSLLKSLSENPWFSGLWAGWKGLLENNFLGLKDTYGEDYINNILGEKVTFINGGGGHDFGSNIGEQMAENVSESYSNTLVAKKISMSDSTVEVAKANISELETAIKSDTTVATAFDNMGSNSGDSLKSGFNKASITSHFKGVWEGIQKIFSNVKTWFSDTFGGAWDKVKAIFSDNGGINNIKQSVEDVFKNTLNKLIDGLNNAISFPFESLNSAISALRNFEFMSQKPFTWLPTITAPRIPKLATGTVVPANYGEFLAVLGDNKRETEVVSPLSTIERAVENALVKAGFNSGNSQPEEINIYIDGDKVFKVVVDRNNSYKKSHGKSALA